MSRVSSPSIFSVLFTAFTQEKGGRGGGGGGLRLCAIVAALVSERLFVDGDVVPVPC